MNIAIVGLGLIGGSLGRAIIKKTEHRVFGSDVDVSTVLKAELLGAINEPLTDENIASVDFIIFALTPKVFYSEVEKYLPKLKDGAVVMDIIGVKNETVRFLSEVSSRYPSLEFVSTHPMAGKEFSGISYSSPALFERASILLIAVKAEIQTLAEVKSFFLSLGFDYARLTTVQEHDELIAYTSQLAHIASSAFVNSPLAERHDGFSSGSFKDLTRVARMNSAMWAELFIENKEKLLNVLNDYITNLQEIQTLLESSDFDGLAAVLEEGNLKKEQIETASREWKKTMSKL